MDSKSQDSIQVCIRVKPGNQQQSLVQFSQNEIHLEKNHFGFDKIFTPDATQQDIFQFVGKKVISHTLYGYNGCIFVYGQTGSGKTYTMMGDGNGLMQKSFVNLFQQIQNLQKLQCLIYCSYYEIYNEQIIDLLDVRRDKKLNIRQDLKKGVFIENIVQQTVTNETKLLDCLNMGMKNRHVGETMMNRQSSRSHSIFTISFSIKTQSNGVQHIKTPKLHFVDLAGSQRQKMTAASGERLKQAGNINKSLTTLGMVINALASQKTRTHIPYRDSKLTNLLRDSLGGNSKTYLIATISRNILCFQQTLSTLNFANRAKMVKVKAQVNQQSLSTNIQSYKEQIRRLKAQIQRLKCEKSTPSYIQTKILGGRSVQQNPNFDNQFKEINQKINVISDHLVKNPISPSLQELVNQINKLKQQVFTCSQGQKNNEKMIDQNSVQADKHESELVNQQQQEQQDPLIQYLSCNNSLLQKIHSKIDQYVQLKEQLRSLAYNNQLSIASLKTPSKFERQQYEQIIQKRDQHISDLHVQLKQLRKVIEEQQLRIQQIISESKGKVNLNESQMEKYQKQRSQLQRELITLRNLLKQTNQQLQLINQKLGQAQAECKQNKQLYLFSQQNYQTQRALRDQIQKNLMDKVCQIQNVKLQYTDKLLQQKEYYQEIEQRLKQQLNILTQTLQFNQNKILDFKTKLDSQKQSAKLLLLQIQQFQESNRQIINQKQTLQQKLTKAEQEVQNLEKCLKSSIEKFNQSISKKDQQILNKNQKFELYVANSKSQAYIMQQSISQKDKIIQNLREQIQELLKQVKLKCQQYQQEIGKLNHNYQGEIKRLNQYNQKNRLFYQQKLQISQEQRMALDTSLCQVQQSLHRQKQQLQSLQNEHQRLQHQSQQKIQRIYEQTKSRLQMTKVLQVQNEELKKQYKILQKQNYKIKSKNSQTTSNSQQQLSSKVDYYEQKFKLMSIEYQKAMEVVKKLKQKQINQAQKIINLEESQKLVKMNNNNEQINGQRFNTLKKLGQQNVELKKELQFIKLQINKQESAQSYRNKISVEQQKTILKQKQEYFRRKIQQSINRWDPSKENIVNRNLQDLIHCWEQIQAQSCKKFDAITKGIKRQQKLKTQNSLILKQNIYLKQQISNYEKQLCEKLGQPRKLVKIDLMQISEDSMEQNS